MIEKYFITALAILGPSLILIGLYFLFTSTGKSKRTKKTKDNYFLGIDNLKSVIRNQKDYPLLKPRKLSRKERREQKWFNENRNSNLTAQNGKNKKA